LRRRKTRTRRLELGAALAAALTLSACGGARHAAPPPTISRPLASSLATQTDAVAAALAAGDSCRALTLARTLRQRTIAAINQHRVDAALQEQLSSAVNALVVRVHCAPPPVAPVREDKHDQEHGHGKHKGHDKKHDGDD